ncbi:MAG: hypothetical protein ACRENB_08420, partial [Gemmatimonadales bacterium]
MRHRSVAALLVAVLPFTVQAQAPSTTASAKRVLTQADWDRWRSISSPSIANDGRWVLYTLIPQVGDGEMVVRLTQGATEYRVPRGFLGRPNNVPGGLRPAGGTGEADPAPPTASPGQFTSDSRFAVVLVQPTQVEVERAARRPGGRTGARSGSGPEPSRTSLAIVNLSDGKVTSIPRVRSFRLPRANGTWLAYLAEADSTASDTTARGGQPAQRAAQPSGPRRTYGLTLVLRNLATEQEERLADVLMYAFDDSASVMAYTVVSRDSTRDGAFVRQ